MLPLLEKMLLVQKPASGLPGSLISQYKSLGVAAGFIAEPLEKGVFLRGKTVKLAIKVEFGNRWEFFNTITALRETDADIKVIATSSNVKSISMEAIYTVLKKKLMEKFRWVLIDIEGKKEPMFLNFSSSDRRVNSFQQQSNRQSGSGRVHSKPAQEKPSQSTSPQAGISVSPREGNAPTSTIRGSASASPQKSSASTFRQPPSKPAHGGNSPISKPSSAAPTPSGNHPVGIVHSIFDKARRVLSKYSGGPNPVLLKKTKNYGLQPANAPARRKKIYGKRKKKQD